MADSKKIDWRSEYFYLFHEYDVLIDKLAEKDRKIGELLGVIAQLEKAEEADRSSE